MGTAPAATLWFLAPGLAHLLGNALFTVQGRARLLTGATEAQLADDCRAIQDGVDRAHAGLDLLRWLLGEGRPFAVPIDEVLGTFVDVARVPLRDQGAQLELDDERQPLAATVDPTSACQLLTAMCRTLVEGVGPGAPHARIRIDRHMVGAAVQLIARRIETAGARVHDPSHVDRSLRTELLQVGVAWADDGTALVAALPTEKATLKTP